MKRKRIPPDAFEIYMSLGPGRSYQAAADRLGVSKRAVTERAAKERWQEKVEQIEAKARQGAEQRMVETLEEMNSRHLKSLRLIQARAIEALRGMTLESAMDAVRALEISVRQERLIRGEPSERAAVQVEEVIRGQFSRWMTVDGSGPEGQEGGR